MSASACMNICVSACMYMDGYICLYASLSVCSDIASQEEEKVSAEVCTVCWVRFIDILVTLTSCSMCGHTVPSLNAVILTLTSSSCVQSMGSARL